MRCVPISQAAHLPLFLHPDHFFDTLASSPTMPCMKTSTSACHVPADSHTTIIYLMTVPTVPCTYPRFCSYSTNFYSNFCFYSSLYLKSSTVAGTRMTCCHISVSAPLTLCTCSTVHPHLCFHYTACPPLSPQILHRWSTPLLGLSPLALDVPMVPFQRHSHLCSEPTQPPAERDSGADPPLSGKPDLEAFRSLSRALVF